MELKEIILGELRRNDNILIVHKKENYDNIIDDLYGKIFEKYKKICVVGTKLLLLKLENKFNSKNISFIECNSGKYKLIGKFMGRNLGKRKKLKDVKLDILSAVKKDKLKIVILDNIDCLLKTNNKITVLKFLNEIINELRKVGVKSICIMDGEHMRCPVEETILFADSVIIS
jgi:hypothetical protein